MTCGTIECISADGRSLLPLIIWPAATHGSNWTTYPTPGWHYGHSENGYNDSKISLEWLKRVFDPQTKGLANGKPRVLICDGFGTHETLEILEFCLKNNILLCRLPSHTSHKLQPCDVGPFAPLKTAYRDEVERLNRGGIDVIGKEHFTSLYAPARIKALTERNIRAGWTKTELFPLNAERVLRDIPMPPPPAPRADEKEAVPCAPNEVPPTPVTPVTPVTAEALIPLRNLIKEDARTLDEASKRRLERHVQKLASAARISFAECALLQDQNQFLIQVNKEATVRRSTRPIVLGKAKVMSYEDLEEARAKRAAKDKASASKGKRGRKSKNAEPETEAPRTSASVSELEPWKAPVAKMY
jgi:hypothetical protein